MLRYYGLVLDYAHDTVYSNRLKRNIPCTVLKSGLLALLMTHAREGEVLTVTEGLLGKRGSNPASRVSCWHYWQRWWYWEIQRRIRRSLRRCRGELPAVCVCYLIQLCFAMNTSLPLRSAIAHQVLYKWWGYNGTTLRGATVKRCQTLVLETIKVQFWKKLRNSSKIDFKIS